MLNLFKRNPLAVTLAVMLHIAIVLFLLFGLDWIEKPQRPKAAVVQAHTVDASKLEAEVNKIKASEEKAQAEKVAALEQEKKRLDDLKRKQVAEEKRLAALEQQRKERELQERKHKEEVKKKAEAEAKRKVEAKKKAEAEAKRKAEAKKKAEAEAKKKAEAEAKRKAEAKKKAEAEAKRKAEAKKKAEADAKRKAEAAAQASREKALQDQLAAEQAAREIDRYVVVVKQQIERRWLRPPNAGQALSCVVQVRLIPGGEVVPGGVSIIKSSGNAAFDRSVETAVYRAAPLPVPSGALFEEFRTLKLYFKPSGK